MRTQWWLAEGSRADAPLAEVRRAVSTTSWLTVPHYEQVINDLAAGRSLNRKNWHYEPAFFDRAHEKIREAAAQLHNLDHPAADLVHHYIQQATHVVDTFTHVRTDKVHPAEANQTFTDWSSTKFGLPEQSVIQEAYTLLEAHPASGVIRTTRRAKEAETAASEELGQVVERCQRLLDEVTTDWTVSVKPMLPDSVVSSARKVVWLSQHLRDWPTPEVARTLVHEIGTHAYRTINAQSASGTIAGVFLGPDAHLTQEGLAVWWEYRLGLGSVAARRYAARVVAVDIALHGSIYDVFNVLSRYLPSRLAATTALRVKRGLADPTLPGAYTKDHVYASGHRLVRSYIADHGEGVLPLLMSSKWGLSCLPLVEQMHTDGMFEGATRAMPTERLRNGL
ncbi:MULTISPECIES: tyrosine/phenylalanine carboxypeptidase domain-containing protein [unclassified Nocardioides]|uniref:tyrosine/phenylalanine carboxypeptidase domain-containing protein n=1 Tax=unclassified Nocardioides TaxID=2615069 RepID=UPI003014E23D